ncbi:polysaccharide biosynthesis/export family protein [Sphingomonas sp. NFR15]|uniref:polysaccharide biosynthesis/export family protein n=1 Tax=Sphingomonas sp. NFR15 TaxID=1566282 RepID=UPI00088A7AF7|nr:polysaccharide biosynthesis/export family protein [Sphingomonas sp. NFR15]SDA12578.1 polysaccharide export outer membrane protein [Sphingomonas sp. NFR15]
MSARLRTATVASLLALSACSALPGGGPSAGTMRKAPEVDVVAVTPELAAAARERTALERDTALANALARLGGAALAPEFRFAPGDVAAVSVWSFSPWPGSGAGMAGGPNQIDLGSFTLANDGTVILPYAGRLALAGMTLAQAQQAVAARYVTLRILQRPSALVKVSASPHSDILVTGAVGQPRTVGWSAAGVTLAQAVTQALGDGNATLGAGDLSATRAAVRVAVLREGAAPVEIPVAAALEERIALQPGDRVVVRKAPSVEVTMLGGGTRRNGVIGFAKQPALAEALAEANGLDGNTANDHAVFVLRRREGAKPVLYDFAWKRGAGLVAAQDFPLDNGDVVYVSEAPIVSIQKVIGLLFQVTLPAQVLK